MCVFMPKKPYIIRLGRLSINELLLKLGLTGV